MAQVANPANLSAAGSGTRWEASLLVGQTDVDFRRQRAASVSSAGDYRAYRDYPVIPAFAVSHAYSDRLILGLALDMPNYLDIEWKDHTFDHNFSGTHLDVALKSKFRATRIGPAAALRLDKRWSVGGRFFAQHVYTMEKSDIARLEGDGTTFGAQLGTRYAGDGYIIGAAYTTRTNTEVRGTQSEIHPLFAGTLVAGPAKTDIRLPDRLSIHGALALRPDLWWEAEAEWFGWSYFDKRFIYQADGTLANAGKTDRHYRNIVTVRTGLRWLMNKQTALYAAIGYEPTPVPEEDVTPIVSFLRRTRLMLGMAWQPTEEWRADLSYQFIRGHNRTINGSDQDSFVGVDTRLYEGTYSSKAHALRLTISSVF